MKRRMVLTAIAALALCLIGCPGPFGAFDNPKDPGSSAYLSPSKSILSFSFPSPGAAGFIDEGTKTIQVTVPFGTDVTSLVAVFNTTGVSVRVGSTSQTSGATGNDFSGPVVYTVVAADSTTAEYTVTVTVALNTAKEITSFGFSAPAVSGIINESLKTVSVTVPFCTDVTSLVATFYTTGAVVEVGSTIQTSDVTSNDFTDPVVYKVTAVDGSSAFYTVTVTVALNSAKAITEFSILSPAATGVINEGAKTITVKVPFGTNRSALVAVFTTTGESVKIGATTQVSGTTINDFTSTKVYTITAEDGSTANYSVSVVLTYTVTYSGNGATSGTIPTDSNQYTSGSTVTVLGNTGSLAKTGYLFAGWNTAANGTGINRAVATTFIMPAQNLILYARWMLPISMVSSGNYHTMILQNDGLLWAVGDGFGTTANQFTTGVSSVSCGLSYTMRLNATGSLFANGNNFWGQLGDGTTTDKPFGVKVMDGIAAVSCGRSHTMILKLDGSLWAMGLNYEGQLGDGTTTDRHTPVQILTGVAEVFPGYYHTMIMKLDSSLWATGRNNDGQLGDGTTTSRSTPVQVMDGVAAVSAGVYHTMILKLDGSVWATGGNYHGQFGDGSTVNRTTPLQVMDGVAAVSCGGYHTMILKTDGSLWATGHNNYGQLGDGTTIDRSTPIQVMDGVAAVSCGAYHTMILKTDGSLWTTGYNNYGQLGDGSTTSHSTPIQFAF